MTESSAGLQNLDSVTGSEIRTVTFATAKGFGRGYDFTEVDAFVERCAAVVDQLREMLNDRGAQLALLHDRMDREAEGGEVEQAMTVLMTAQQTADQTVARADDYSAKVMAEARALYEDTRRQAATLELEARDEAQRIHEAALRQAQSVELEAAERLARLAQDAESTQEELDRQTGYLRTLRDTTRTQIQVFLEGLLDHVADEYGRAHPKAAEAVSESTNRTSTNRTSTNRASTTGATAPGGIRAGQVGGDGSNPPGTRAVRRSRKAPNRSARRVAGRTNVPQPPPVARALPTQPDSRYVDDPYFAEFSGRYRDR